MRKGVCLVVLCGVLVVCGAASAEEKAWSDQAEFSLVNTTGNSEVTTISFKNDLKYTFNPKLLGLWKLGGLYGKSDGDTNAERYFTELRLDYLFTERFYSYGNGGWYKDRFAGIDARWYGGAGVGYKLLTGPTHSLLGEVGLNYTTEDYTDGSSSEFVAARLFGKYVYNFTEKNSFSQSLEFIEDTSRFSNYLLISETALTAALSTNLALKATYTVRYDNEPVPDTFDETDTILGIALVVNF